MALLGCSSLRSCLKLLPSQGARSSASLRALRRFSAGADQEPRAVRTALAGETDRFGGVTVRHLPPQLSQTSFSSALRGTAPARHVPLQSIAPNTVQLHPSVSINVNNLKCICRFLLINKNITPNRQHCLNPPPFHYLIFCFQKPEFLVF